MSKVLMFGWEYAPYYSGGLGIVTRSIVTNLKKQGMDIIFVLPRVPFEVEDEFLKIINAAEIKIENIQAEIFTKINIDTFLTPYTSPAQFRENLSNLINLKSKHKQNSNEIYGTNLIEEVEKYAHKALDIAKKNNHDVIHTHDWMTGKAGKLAKSVSEKPMIMHVHATEFDRSGGNPNQLVYDVEKEGMESSDQIIAVSEMTKQRIVKNYGISPDKIKVVHNAIENIHGGKRIGEKLNKTDKIVLFLGRLTLQKGADYLLEAAAKVLEHKKRVKFVFIGHGDMLEYLVKKSIELGIEQKVMFTGFMDHNEVDRAYQMADVYVMPSIAEPFGITSLEAIKNGTPVIMSKQSGVSEVIQNALKVDFWDIDELANQILGIIRYAPLASFMTKNAEEELKKLTWENQTKKIVDIYNSIS